MSINLTLAELKGMEAPLTRLLEQQLPIKASYRLSKILRLISKELTELENHRKDLIRNLGEVLENGDVTISNPENLQKFQDEFTELLKEAVEFDYAPLSIEALGENLTLTVAEVSQLSVLFTD